MRRIILMSFVVVSTFIFSACVSDELKPEKKMQRFQAVALDKTTMLQTGEQKHACPECGMKLPMFYKTNHAATSNGKVKQYCSIHCLVDDKMNNKSAVSDMKVVAVDTLKFIDVNDAIYVVGSDVKGTMSGLSKYAFEGRMSAKRFTQKHEGKIMSFDEAYAYAKRDFQP